MQSSDYAREMLQTGRRGLVGALAGGAWMAWGTISAHSFTPAVIAAFVLAASFLLACCGYCMIQGMRRLRQSGERLRRSFNKGFLLLSILEGAAVGGVIFAAQKLGRLDLLPAWVGIVIGLHFFALARVFRLRRYNVVGLAITAWCVLAWTLFRGESLTVGVGLGVGVILWSATSIFLVRVIARKTSA